MLPKRMDEKCMAKMRDISLSTFLCSLNLRSCDYVTHTKLNGRERYLGNAIEKQIKQRG